MWQAKIARTERNNGQLDIIVTYSNGESEFSETISTREVQGEGWLQDQITTRLTQLNQLDVFEQTIIDSNIKEAVLTIDSSTSEVVLSPIGEK